MAWRKPFIFPLDTQLGSDCWLVVRHDLDKRTYETKSLTTNSAVTSSHVGPPIVLRALQHEFHESQHCP